MKTYTFYMYSITGKHEYKIKAYNKSAAVAQIQNKTNCGYNQIEFVKCES